MKDEFAWKVIPQNHTTIDFAGCHYAEDIHTVLKDSLGFPDRYGANWSAFWDYLDDFCGDREENNTIRLVGLAKLPKDLNDYAQKMLEIFHRAEQQYPLIRILEETD